MTKSNLIRELKEILERNEIRNQYTGDNFIRSILLSIVLYDMLSQILSIIIEEYIDKIKYIAAKNGLSDEKI